MATCSACGTPNVDGVKFCVNCGAQMAPQPEGWRTETDLKEEVEQIYTPPNYTDALSQAPFAQPPAYQAPNAGLISRVQGSNLPQSVFTVGIIAICLMGLGLIPCFGWLNWLTIPVSLIAIVLGILAIVNKKAGDTNNKATIGLVLGGVALFVGFIRLALGGGCL